MTRTQTLGCSNRAPNSDKNLLKSSLSSRYSKCANNTTDYFDAIAALVAQCLFLGFLTPCGAAGCCLLELAVLANTHTQNRFQLVISALTAAVTALLGPGAYSVDARLFGRKLIKIPPGRN